MSQTKSTTQKIGTKVTALAGILFVLGAGAASIEMRGQNLQRGRASSTVVIGAWYPGASAESVEREVLKPLESAVARTRGLQRVDGSARPEIARIEATYAGFGLRDTTELLQLVRGAVLDLQSHLPPDVELTGVNLAARRWLSGGSDSTLTDWILLASGLALTGLAVLFTHVRALRPRGVRYWYERLLERFHEALAWTLRNGTRTVMAAGVCAIAICAAYMAWGSTQFLKSHERGSVVTSPDVEIDVWGPDGRILTGLVKRVSDEIRQVPRVIDVRSSDRDNEIHHRNGERWAGVCVIVAPNEPAVTEHEIHATLNAIQLPPGHRMQVGGALQRTHLINTRIAVIVAAALILFFAIIAWRYQSILLPLAIAAGFAFAVVGALCALLATGQSLTLRASLGIVPALFMAVWHGTNIASGAVLRHLGGTFLRVTLVHAGRAAFRSVLLMMCVVSLALLPLAAFGSPLWKAPAIVGIGSALTTALAVLFVIPALIDGGVAFAMRARARRIARPA